MNEEHVRRPDDALLGLRFNAGRVQNALGTRGRGYRSKGEGQIERKGGERERERERERKRERERSGEGVNLTSVYDLLKGGLLRDQTLRLNIKRVTGIYVHL